MWLFEPALQLGCVEMTVNDLANQFHELLALIGADYRLHFRGRAEPARRPGSLPGNLRDGLGEIRRIHPRQQLRPLGVRYCRLEILEHQRRFAREKRWLSEHALLRLAEAASDRDAEAVQRRHEHLASCFASLSTSDQRLIEKCYVGTRMDTRASWAISPAKLGCNSQVSITP